MSNAKSLSTQARRAAKARRPAPCTFEQWMKVLDNLPSEVRRAITEAAFDKIDPRPFAKLLKQGCPVADVVQKVKDFDARLVAAAYAERGLTL